MYQAYDQVLGMLVSIIMNPGDWSFLNEQLKSEGLP